MTVHASDSTEPGTQELPSDNSASALSAQAVNAPVFVPRSVASPQLSERTVISYVRFAQADERKGLIIR